MLLLAGDCLPIQLQIGGIGTRIRQELRSQQVDTALNELGLPDEFIEHASRSEILERVGLTAQLIAIQEFSHLTLPAEKTEKLERWRSVAGIHELKQVRALTVVKSLWDAREKLAKEKDVAPGRLVPDLSLVSLAKAAPKTKSELASLRSFTGRASRTYLDLWKFIRPVSMVWDSAALCFQFD